MKEDNKKILNVPHLRFKEFNNEWKSNRLGKCAELKKGSGLSKTDLSNSGFKCILYGQLYTTYKNEIINEVVSVTNKKSNNYVYSEMNDIIIPASGETAEDISVARCVKVPNVIIGGDLNIIRLHNLDGSFFSYQLNGKRKIDIAKIAIGKSIVHLHNEDIAKLLVYFPSDISEQQKIANFLTLIDKRIETQMKIIEEYKSLIKGIRERIFFKNKGNTINLSEILCEVNKRNVGNNLEPVAVGKYGIRKRSEIYYKELSEDLSKNKIIEKDTLVIGMGTSQIDIGIQLDDKAYCVSPAYTTYKIKNINSSYLNELLIYQNPLLSKKYMIVSARQGKSVNKKDLLDHMLTIHDKDDQIKIATIFQKLYLRIKIESTLLNCFENSKKYLLSNLFI